MKEVKEEERTKLEKNAEVSQSNEIEPKKEIEEKQNIEKNKKNVNQLLPKTKVETDNEKEKLLSYKIKKILKNTLEIIYESRIIVIIIGILLLLKTLYIYKLVIFPTKPITWQHTQMAAVFIAIIITIPMLLKGKARVWIALLIDLLVSILLFINDLYYSYSSNLVSISQISNLQYGKEISAALPYLLHIRQVVYFIDLIILFVIFVNIKNNIKKLSKLLYIPGVLYLIAMIIISGKTVKKWLDEAQEHQYNKIMQIDASSIYGYHFLDIRNNLNMKKNVKYKNKDTMLKAYNELMASYDEKYPLKYDFAGIAEGKNVVIVQLESVQNFVAHRKINGKEITPNLNKFLDENIEFTNMQNQSYSTTADSEFTVMTSLYPLENGMSYAQYPSNDYNDIYKNFKSKEYTTTYIHGNVGSFWNREAVYSRLKIDHLYFDNVFDSDVERINEYVSDEAVYKKIIDDMKTYDDKFFVNIVASSSHTAFDLPGIQDKWRKVNIDVGDDVRGIYYGNYLEAVNYADYAFGIFIDELKKAGLYDDTVILVYGDHAGLQMYNWEMQDFIREKNPGLNDIQTQINYTNILCGLKIPGVEPMKISKPTSKIDMKPTLMEICGIEDEFSLGRSMFSSKDFICINNGKIITDKYFYDGDWYLISTGEQLNLDNMPKEEVEKLNYYCECLQKELDISLSVNILNLLKK